MERDSELHAHKLYPHGSPDKYRAGWEDGYRRGMVALSPGKRVSHWKGVVHGALVRLEEKLHDKSS